MSAYLYVLESVCVCVRACACVRACMHFLLMYACTGVCVCAYSRTHILRPPSKSDWSGRITGAVVHEGLDYFITCGLRHMCIYILPVSSTLRTSFGMHCRTWENTATYPLRRLQAWLTQNSIGLVGRIFQ